MKLSRKMYPQNNRARRIAEELESVSLRLMIRGIAQSYVGDLPGSDDSILRDLRDGITIYLSEGTVKND